MLSSGTLNETFYVRRNTLNAPIYSGTAPSGQRDILEKYSEYSARYSQRDISEKYSECSVRYLNEMRSTLNALVRCSQRDLFGECSVQVLSTSFIREVLLMLSPQVLSTRLIREVLGMLLSQRGFLEKYSECSVRYSQRDVLRSTSECSVRYSQRDLSEKYS